MVDLEVYSTLYTRIIFALPAPLTEYGGTMNAADCGKSRPSDRRRADTACFIGGVLT